MPWLMLALSVFLVAWDNAGSLVITNKDDELNFLSDVKAKLEYKCAHEKIPEPSAAIDSVFQYARWLQKNNQLKQDKNVILEVERLYRIASEHDHYKANINLQNGAMRGEYALRDGEYLRLSQRLIEANVATGYYFIAILLNQGGAGLKKDPDTALRYYRKAADEGNAMAQYYLGRKLEPKGVAPEIAMEMYRCAAEQGHGKAAVALAISLEMRRSYQEALKMYQLGVAGGAAVAAYALKEGFNGAVPSDKVNYLGQSKDLERVERYKKIELILSNYSYANPTVLEIDHIVPLPPAKLPPWDGKLQWLEARLANIPPEKPTEALIHNLAKEKILDPATGKPIPGSPAFSQADFPIIICASGEPCPESGYWKVMNNSWENHIKRFEKGEIMPTYQMTWSEPRLWPLRDKIMQRETRVNWGLLG
ncbi:sel1 repeat family protein [Pseudomonas sp. P39-UII1]|uniref:SEL1-like repeat protein n=1 Tax=Pseudomonas sp. P39-UII1 TaxID=3080333 RepID=UPI0032086ADC